MSTLDPTSAEYASLDAQYINGLNQYNAACIEYEESYNNFLVELAKLNCISLSEPFDIPSSTIRIYKLS